LQTVTKLKVYMRTNQDITYMQRALELAHKAASLGEVPIGAIVVSPAGEIIGEGLNQTETLQCQDQHAEMCAIRAATTATGDWRLDGCTIYITLEPCVMCLGCIVLSRIERIVYAAESPLFGFHVGDENVYELYAKKVKNITAGVCKEESQALLKQFFKEQRSRES
jgi:tRNA(adenine34) deaminase